MARTESPGEYAQRRAKETGRPYLVTALGHALPADAHTRALAERELGGIVRVYKRRAL